MGYSPRHRRRASARRRARLPVWIPVFVSVLLASVALLSEAGAAPSGTVVEVAPGGTARLVCPAGTSLSVSGRSPGSITVVCQVSNSGPPGDAFSAFDAPLSPAAPLDPNSAGYVAGLVHDSAADYGSVGVNDSLPIVTVPADQPLVPIGTRCRDFSADTGAMVPIPPNAASYENHSGDNPLVIWQPATGTEWEFWQISASAPWSACWGGKLTGLDGAAFPSPFGLSASGISYLATAITEADVASGAIRHPLAITLPDCAYPAVAPAVRTDCGPHPGYAHEGTLFRFPAGLTMPPGLTPFAQMVFTALQDYGAYVIDFGGAVMVSAENPADWTLNGNTGTDPITASWDTMPQYRVIAPLPWPSLQAIAPPG